MRAKAVHEVKYDLAHITELLLELCCVDLLDTGDPGAGFYCYGHGTLVRLPIDQDQAGRLMNSGDAKDALYGLCRGMTQRKPDDITAWFFTNEAWMAQLKDQDLARRYFENDPEARKILHGKNVTTLYEEGLCDREEAVIVTGQDKDTVLIRTQPFERDEQTGKIIRCDQSLRRENTFPQSGFRGRQKMFGDLRPENLS